MRDDLETLVLDADLLEAVLGSPDPTRKAKEVTIKLTARCESTPRTRRTKPWRSASKT